MTQPDANTQPADSTPYTQPVAEISLGQRAARGFVWTGTLTLLGKIVSMVCQIVLARLLTKEDFGLVAMTLATGNLCMCVSDATFQNVLVRRQKYFTQWAPAFAQLSFLTGLTSALLIVLIAPFAGWFYAEPRVVGLLHVQAIAPVIGSLLVLPMATLQVQLAFRSLAILTFLKNSLIMLLAMVFAIYGYAAYSLLLPGPVVLSLLVVVTWMMVRPKLEWKLNFKRFRYILSDIGFLGLTNIMVIVVSTGDYVVLGYFQDTASVGIYFFAFNFAQQTFYLLSASMANVLRPTLSRYAGQPKLQAEKFLKMAELSAWLLCFACLFQVFAARPLVHLLFGAKWDAAVPIVQLLSIGWVGSSVGGLSFALIEAQGRYRKLFNLQLLYAIIFMAMVTPAAAFGDKHWVAAAVGLHFLVICGPGSIFLATRSDGVPIWRTLKLYAAPIFAGCVALAIPTLLMRGWFGHRDRLQSLIEIGLLVAVSVPSYAILMYVMDRNRFQALRTMIFNGRH